MDKRFWVIVAAILVAFVGFIVINNKDKASAPDSDSKGTPTENVRGEGTVTLVEYGDFQCPACAQYHPIVEQVVEKYEGQIKFQFRNFPLVSIHPNAFAAARAGEAAAQQGKFWEMYDKLFNNQQDWSDSKNPREHFDNYAKQIGLDTEKFKTDFASSRTNDAINADISAAEKVGAQSTPTFVLDGKKINNPQPSVDAFSKVIDEAIKNKKQ